MIIRLIGLQLTNFQGVSDFTFKPDGRNANVLGDNALGKTTLANAFFWLLFGKDAAGRSDFAIKTLTPDGEPVHNLEHSVKAVFAVDGEIKEFRKVLQEKYTKKRGAPRAEFTGHTVDHYVDGVPVKESEFSLAIRATAGDEQKFRLATNPRYFCEGLAWRERRRLLLEICGDVSDPEVVDSDPALADLPGILGKHSIDDHRKVVTARRAEINRELTEIPARIDEANRSMLPVEESREAIEAQVEDVRWKISEFDREILEIRNGGLVAAKQKDLRQAEADLIDLRNRSDREHREQQESCLSAIRKELAEKRNLLEEISGLVTRNGREIIDRERTIDELERKLQATREEWSRVDGRKFEYGRNCPTCGQAYPEEMVEIARAGFNETKAVELEEVRRKGHAVRDEIKGHRDAVEKLRAAGEDLLTQIGQVREEVARAESAKAEATEAVSGRSPEREAHIDILQAKIDTLRQEMEAIRRGDLEAVRDREASRDALRPELERLENALANLRSNDRTAARIDELIRQEKDAATAFEKLEGELNLMDQFLRAKVRMLEDRINQKFRFVRFQLFEQQINGGLNECCEATVEGVPYGSVNEAARINAGLDICNAISAHYRVVAPVWIDKAESVNAPLKTLGQQIRLIVSHDDKLRVEVQDE